jgi:hypothetical protein
MNEREHLLRIAWRARNDSPAGRGFYTGVMAMWCAQTGEEPSDVAHRLYQALEGVAADRAALEGLVT